MLPDGASREDLISTTRIREYVHKNALEWYTFLNSKSPYVPFPNGSLTVVTGVDKAIAWASCTSAPREYGETAKRTTFRYQDQTWVEGKGRIYTKVNPIQNTGKCALFIRGIRFAVNIHNWMKHILLDEPTLMMSYYNILSVRINGLWAWIQGLKEQRRSYIQDEVICPLDPVGRSSSSLYPLLIMLLCSTYSTPWRLFFEFCFTRLVHIIIYSNISLIYHGSLLCPTSPLQKIICSVPSLKRYTEYC